MRKRTSIRKAVRSYLVGGREAIARKAVMVSEEVQGYTITLFLCGRRLGSGQLFVEPIVSGFDRLYLAAEALHVGVCLAYQTV